MFHCMIFFIIDEERQERQTHTLSITNNGRGTRVIVIITKTGGGKTIRLKFQRSVTVIITTMCKIPMKLRPIKKSTTYHRPSTIHQIPTINLGNINQIPTHQMTPMKGRTIHKTPPPHQYAIYSSEPTHIMNSLFSESPHFTDIYYITYPTLTVININVLLYKL